MTVDMQVPTRKIFVISDTHFGHENIIRFCNRPFADADEMDSVLISNWNKVVSDQDIVYHLGDVYFRNPENVLKYLKGRKRLILGNHDNGKDPMLLKYFQKIMVWRMFPEYGLLLTHVPVHPSSLEFKVKKNVHGHIHQNKIDDPRYINVSVEHIGYMPVDIRSLV